MWFVSGGTVKVLHDDSRLYSSNILLGYLRPQEGKRGALSVPMYLTRVYYSRTPNTELHLQGRKMERQGP